MDQILSITLNGQEYPLSTKLRVAFEIQGQFRNKPYMEIFQGLQSQKLEEQIKILYIACKVHDSTINLDEKSFRDAVLDEVGLNTIIELCGNLIQGIMYHGLTNEEVAEKKRQAIRLMNQNPAMFMPAT